MNKEYVMAAILLGIMCVVCIAHLMQPQSISSGKWAFTTVSSFVGFCLVIARIIEGRR
jgi:hypothetical protein